MKKLLGAAALVAGVVVAASVAALVLFLMAVAGMSQAQARPTAGPSERAVSNIPPDLLAVYQDAATQSCALR